MRTQDVVETKKQEIGQHKWKHLSSTCKNTGKIQVKKFNILIFRSKVQYKLINPFVK